MNGKCQCLGGMDKVTCGDSLSTDVIVSAVKNCNFIPNTVEIMETSAKYPTGADRLVTELEESIPGIHEIIFSRCTKLNCFLINQYTGAMDVACRSCVEGRMSPPGGGMSEGTITLIVTLIVLCCLFIGVLCRFGGAYIISRLVHHYNAFFEPASANGGRVVRYRTGGGGTIGIGGGKGSGGALPPALAQAQPIPALPSVSPRPLAIMA